MDEKEAARRVIEDLNKKKEKKKPVKKKGADETEVKNEENSDHEGASKANETSAKRERHSPSAERKDRHR